MNNKNKEKIFENIFFNHHTRLCNYAFQYVYDINIAKDIVQDVFCDFWLQLENIDISKPVTQLLFTYTKHKSINYLNNAYNRKRELGNIENLSPDGNIQLLIIEDLLENVQANDLVEILEKGIKELPIQCQKVFLLSRKDGLKNKEIAESLDISIKTVEKHITKALSFIKDYLEKRGYNFCILLICSFLKKITFIDI